MSLSDVVMFVCQLIMGAALSPTLADQRKWPDVRTCTMTGGCLSVMTVVMQLNGFAFTAGVMLAIAVCWLFMGVARR